MKPFHARLPAMHPGSYFSMASGGLGLPAPVGMALAERETGRNRPVIAMIGDGSFLYSVQSLWTAVHLGLPGLDFASLAGRAGIRQSHRPSRADHV